MRASCLMALTLLAASVACASEVPSFDEANRLYEQARYRDAAEAYSRLIAAGTNSAALWYNLGNARFKAGQVGDAIAAYRQAERVTPRDPDVRANLEFARRQVAGPALRPNWLQRRLAALTTNEWTLLALLPAWGWFALLICRQLRPAWKQSLRTATWLSGLAALVAGGALGLVLQDRLSERMVVVNTRDTVVRAGPFEESPSSFSASDGAEFALLDTKDEWYQISDGTKPLGWLKTNAVVELR